MGAQLTQGLVILNNPDISFDPWQTLLMYWAVVLFNITINTVIARYLPAIEGLFMVLHIVGFLAILIPLVYFGPHSDATTVFSSFTNEGGWSTQGLSFMVGLVGPIYSILGTDSAVHVSSFCQNPSTEHTDSCRCQKKSRIRKRTCLEQSYMEFSLMEPLDLACSSLPFSV